MEWLAEAGHSCHILTTARFESPVLFTIEDHFESVVSRSTDLRRRTTRRTNVPVTLLMTTHNDELRPHRAEAARYLALYKRFSPSSFPIS